MLRVAPLRERELKLTYHAPAGQCNVAPLRERELKRVVSIRNDIVRVVAPLRERELKHKQTGGNKMTKSRSLTGA